MAVASFLVLPVLISDFRDSGQNCIYEAALGEGRTEVVAAVDEVEKSVEVQDWEWIWNTSAAAKQNDESSALKVSIKDIEAFAGKSGTLGVDMTSFVQRAKESLDETGESVPLQLNDEEKADIRLYDLTVIRNPYVVLGIVVSVIFLIFLFTKIPDTQGSRSKKSGNWETMSRLWKNNMYRNGVVAQMFYVAAQIMVWTFIIQYADNLGIDKATAQTYNICAMGLFLCSRFVSTVLMRFFSSRTMLAVFGAGALLMSLGAIVFVGMPGLYCLVAISFFMSLMFPTIYGIALEDVKKEDTTLGAAFLVMAIVGGALMPPLQGAILDLESVAGMPAVNISFILPLLCFLVVMVYGIYARRALK
jgi:FHS family L-fucose permease-like MFS transporter